MVIESQKTKMHVVNDPGEDGNRGTGGDGNGTEKSKELHLHY